MAQDDSKSWAALGRIPSGLFILTTRHGGHETGMLASWVQQCAFEPPMITVALKKGRPIIESLSEPDARLVVNVVPEDGRKLLGHFGRGFEPGQPAFEGIPIDSDLASAPVLKNAVAYLDCEVVSKLDAGDHVVFLSRVIAGQMLNDLAPAVHTRKDGSRY